MKKKLRIDTLRVDSFAVDGSADAVRGTVRAHTGNTCASGVESCLGTCDDTCGLSCWGSCVPTCDCA
jgi:hypothetical protein